MVKEIKFLTKTDFLSIGEHPHSDRYGFIFNVRRPTGEAMNDLLLDLNDGTQEINIISKDTSNGNIVSYDTIKNFGLKSIFLDVRGISNTLRFADYEIDRSQRKTIDITLKMTEIDKDRDISLKSTSVSSIPEDDIDVIFDIKELNTNPMYKLLLSD